MCFPSCLPPLPHPKTHTTKSQDRKTLLCLDIINNSYLKHAPMFSHFERTLDTRGLAVDFFFYTAPPTESQTISPFFFFCRYLSTGNNVWPVCLIFGLSFELFYCLPFFSCLPQTLQTHLWFEHKIEPPIIHNSGDILGKQEANCNQLQGRFICFVINLSTEGCITQRQFFFLRKKLNIYFLNFLFFSHFFFFFFFKYPYICKLRSTLNEL